MYFHDCVTMLHFSNLGLSNCLSLAFSRFSGRVPRGTQSPLGKKRGVAGSPEGGLERLGARRKPQENWLYRRTYGTRDFPKIPWLTAIFLHLPVRVRGPPQHESRHWPKVTCCGLQMPLKQHLSVVRHGEKPLRHRPPSLFCAGGFAPCTPAKVRAERECSNSPINCNFHILQSIYRITNTCFSADPAETRPAPSPPRRGTAPVSRWS